MSSVKEVPVVFLLLLASTLVAAQISTPAVQPQRADASGERVVLRGNVHPLARAEFDHGVAPDDLPQRRMLLLLQRSAEKESALERLLEEQWTKSSPNYQKWLSPQEFAERFGPSDSEIQSASNWLGSNGFQVTRIAPGRNR